MVDQQRFEELERALWAAEQRRDAYWSIIMMFTGHETERELRACKHKEPCRAAALVLAELDR